LETELSFRLIRFAPSLAVMAALSIVLASCGGSDGGIPASAVSPTDKTAACPLAVTPDLGGPGCGGGTGGSTYTFTEGNYISRATTATGDSASGSATLSGAAFATFSGNLNTSTGTTTASVTIPSYTSSAVNLQYLNANYIGNDGTYQLPSGGTLTVNASGATATQTDANGTVWTITGAMQSDNRTVALTYSSSLGTFTTNMDSAAWTPAQYAAGNAASVAQRAAAQGREHTDVTAVQVAAVAGCIAAGATLVVAASVFIPGLQPVAGVAGIVAAVSGGVAAGATAWAVFAPQSPAPAPTAKPQ
jgi:hypothetical protein